jgi:hypothetical protein
MDPHSQILNAVVEHRCAALPCGEQSRRPQDRLPPRRAILPSTEAHFSTLLEDWLASEVAPQYQVTRRENCYDVAVVCMDIAFRSVCAQLNDQFATDRGDFKGLVRTGILDAESRGGALPLKWTPENPCVAGYVRSAEARFEMTRGSYSESARLHAADKYFSKMFFELEWKAQDGTSYRCSQLAKRYDGRSRLVNFLCTGMTLQLTAEGGRIHCKCDARFPRSARIVRQGDCWYLRHVRYEEIPGKDGASPRYRRTGPKMHFPLSPADSDSARRKQIAEGANEFEFFSLSVCPHCWEAEARNLLPPKESRESASREPPPPINPQSFIEFRALIVEHLREQLRAARAAKTGRRRGSHREVWEAADEAMTSNTSHLGDWASEKLRRLRQPSARLPGLDAPKLRIGRLRQQTFGESVDLNLEAICNVFANDHGAGALGDVLSYASSRWGDHD